MRKDFDIAIKLAGKVVDNWLPLKIQYDHIPGAVVCIAINGIPKYIKACGELDIEKHIPMKKDAQFRIASMSKMFTAVAIMQLQELGKLRIDDKVSEHLSWFKGKNSKTDLNNVSIRQLLSHSGGLSRDGNTRQWMNNDFPRKIEGTISPGLIVFENGIKFKYSNHGYAVLGALVEKVSGTTYNEYVTLHIIKKLDLKNTLPDLTDAVPRRLISGYERWIPGDISRRLEPHITTHAYASATGFISDARDLSIFLASLHVDSKKSILNRESRKEMIQVHSLPSDNEMYGLGLELDKVLGRLMYGHTGGFAGFTMNAISEVENNIQVIVLTNTSSDIAYEISNNVMHLIYELKKMEDIKFIEHEPYTGIYRCRYGDSTVVSLGKDLVKFDSSLSDPVSNWTLLKKKRQHVFENTEKTGFGSSGEEVRFSEIKNKKAQKMSNDGMVWTRLSV